MFPSRITTRCVATILSTVAALLASSHAFAQEAQHKPHAGGEASLVLPDLSTVQMLGMSGHSLLMIGLAVSALGLLFGFVALGQVRNLPVHKSMSEISNIIWETCKTYLIQQGKFLALLWLFIGAIILVYFGPLRGFEAAKVATILFFSLVGILGSYAVAWFGIRINTYANSRTAFASLEGKPCPSTRSR